MRPVSILLVEEHTVQRSQLAASLEACQDLHVVYAVPNGMDALLCIERTKPDVVILDLSISRLDGFTLLERVNAPGFVHRPLMIVLTTMSRTDFIDHALKLGADEYLVKPIDHQVLIRRVRELVRLSGILASDAPSLPDTPARHRLRRLSGQPGAEPPDPEFLAALRDEGTAKYASLLLLQLGIPAHLFGYQYLVHAVVLTVHFPAVINHVTTQIYPTVAHACDTTPSRVERSIRNAVAAAWDRGGGMAINKLIGRSVTMPAPKPSNSELIAQLSARIRVRGKPLGDRF